MGAVQGNVTEIKCYDSARGMHEADTYSGMLYEEITHVKLHWFIDAVLGLGTWCVRAIIGVIKGPTLCCTTSIFQMLSNVKWESGLIAPLHAPPWRLEIDVISCISRTLIFYISLYYTVYFHNINISDFLCILFFFVHFQNSNISHYL